jgi:plastocyanin domain-containing protein
MRHVLFVSFMVLVSFCFFSAAMGQKNVYKAAVDSDGVQRVEVLVGEYFFNPDYIVVKVNVPVELKIRKEPSIVPHDFVIKAPEAGMDILESLSREPKSITFTPAKTGKYPYYCDKKLIFSKSHREKGMEGTLEVIE